MEIKLKISLLIVCLIFCLFVYRKVKYGKLQLKFSFVWFVITFLLMIFTIFDSILIPIKNFLGFETLSNMIFLVGFLVTMMIIFSLSLKVSDLQMKIIKLTQVVALLENKLRDKE